MARHPQFSTHVYTMHWNLSEIGKNFHQYHRLVMNLFGMGYMLSVRELCQHCDSTQSLQLQKIRPELYQHVTEV